MDYSKCSGRMPKMADGGMIGKMAAERAPAKSYPLFDETNMESSSAMAEAYIKAKQKEEEKKQPVKADK